MSGHIGVHHLRFFWTKNWHTKCTTLKIAKRPFFSIFGILTKEYPYLKINFRMVQVQYVNAKVFDFSRAMLNVHVDPWTSKLTSKFRGIALCTQHNYWYTQQNNVIPILSFHKADTDGSICTSHTDGPNDLKKKKN